MASVVFFTPANADSKLCPAEIEAVTTAAVAAVAAAAAMAIASKACFPTFSSPLNAGSACFKPLANDSENVADVTLACRAIDASSFFVSLVEL